MSWDTPGPSTNRLQHSQSIQNHQMPPPQTNMGTPLMGGMMDSDMSYTGTYNDGSHMQHTSLQQPPHMMQLPQNHFMQAGTPGAGMAMGLDMNMGQGPGAMAGQVQPYNYGTGLQNGTVPLDGDNSDEYWNALIDGTSLVHQSMVEAD